jgi:hypothetical protein
MRGGSLGTRPDFALTIEAKDWDQGTRGQSAGINRSIRSGQARSKTNEGDKVTIISDYLETLLLAVVRLW